MRAFPIVYAVVLIGLSVHALISLYMSTPLLAGLGLLLSCLVPLVFLMVVHFRPPTQRDGHPVMISVLCGFGAVMAMVAVERFGDQYQTFVLGSAVALAGWLIWVRWYWRADASAGR